MPQHTDVSISCLCFREDDINWPTFKTVHTCKSFRNLKITRRHRPSLLNVTNGRVHAMATFFHFKWKQLLVGVPPSSCSTQGRWSRGGQRGHRPPPPPPPPTDPQPPKRTPTPHNVNGSIKQKHTSENVQLLLHSPQNYEVSSYEVSTVRCTVQKSKVWNCVIYNL